MSQSYKDAAGGRLTQAAYEKERERLQLQL